MFGYLLVRPEQLRKVQTIVCKRAYSVYYRQDATDIPRLLQDSCLKFFNYYFAMINVAD
jgi:hypothetical protein